MLVTTNQYSDLTDEYFKLEIKDSTIERFDVSELTFDQRNKVKSILEDWKNLAKTELPNYEIHKSLKKSQKNPNPFNNCAKTITGLIGLLDESSSIFFGAYDKNTKKLEAIAAVMRTTYEYTSFTIGFIATDPKNISTSYNKKRNPGSASALINGLVKRATELKLDFIDVNASEGARTFYEKLFFQPLYPPKRDHWVIPISSKYKEQWCKSSKEYLRTGALDQSDKTEESVDEGVSL